MYFLSFGIMLKEGIWQGAMFKNSLGGFDRNKLHAKNLQKLGDGALQSSLQ
jgi:hypothetical protein